MLLEIVRHPDPRLSQVCAPIAEVTDEVRKLLHDMAYTMLAEDGVGLAAPQVGEMVRAIVVRDDNGTVYGLVNPRIASRSGVKVWGEESCLSDPRDRASRLKIRVRRSVSITVAFTQLDGTPGTMTAKGPQAIALAHEIDHLDGRTIFQGFPAKSFETKTNGAHA